MHSSFAYKKSRDEDIGEIGAKRNDTAKTFCNEYVYEARYMLVKLRWVEIDTQRRMNRETKMCPFPAIYEQRRLP